MDLVLVALANLVAGVLIGCAFRQPRTRPRPKCTMSIVCDALAWPNCSDGRCSYHCQVYCKCLPVGDGVLRVIDGGRSGKAPQ